MLGATASTICSNSARVTTVLQLAALDLSTGGFSHNPGIVITAVAGASVVAAAVLLAADAVAAFGGAGRVAGFAACPQAAVANNKPIHPQ